MSMTLTVGATTVTLEADLLWSDEFAFSTIEQSVSRSVTGALIVQQAVKAATTGGGTSGRPITLQPEDDSSAWTTRAALDQLNVWANTAGLVLTLAGLRGISRSVMFRQHEGAVEARPVVHFSDVDSGDKYRVTLRLMEV